MKNTNVPKNTQTMKMHCKLAGFKRKNVTNQCHLLERLQIMYQHTTCSDNMSDEHTKQFL